VYVTPSHQFPLGVTLSLRRRLELLSWARRHDAYIVEDDYDGEYRYSGRPIEALQTLDDAGRVIYVGTFSKVLFPGLRVGYVVPPAELMRPLRSAKWIADWCTPTLDQLALAEFMSLGHFDRHLRRVRARYGARRAALQNALRSRFDARARFSSANAGLHLAVWFLELPAEQNLQLVFAARGLDVGAYPITPYYLGPPPAEAGVLLGYTLVSEQDIGEGVSRLAEAVETVRRAH
jgi:GntR family transcriptional regulator/MocR family aminotransferase